MSTERFSDEFEEELTDGEREIIDGIGEVIDRYLDKPVAEDAKEDAAAMDALIDALEQTQPNIARQLRYEAGIAISICG